MTTRVEVFFILTFLCLVLLSSVAFVNAVADSDVFMSFVHAAGVVGFAGWFIFALKTFLESRS